MMKFRSICLRSKRCHRLCVRDSHARVVTVVNKHLFKGSLHDEHGKIRREVLDELSKRDTGVVGRAAFGGSGTRFPICSLSTNNPQYPLLGKLIQYFTADLAVFVVQRTLEQMFCDDL